MNAHATEVILNGVTLLLACFMFGSLLLAVAELIAALRLDRWPFRIGTLGLRIAMEMAHPPALSMETRGQTNQLKYRVADGICVFRRRHRFWNEISRWNTPLELKGTVSWSDGTLLITGRYPLGPIMFFAGWWFVWTMIGTVVAFIDGPLAVLCVLIVSLVMLGLLFHSRWLERARFRKYTAELAETLLGPSTASAAA